jgi:hypothetical protein
MSVHNSLPVTGPLFHCYLQLSLPLSLSFHIGDFVGEHHRETISVPLPAADPTGEAMTLGQALRQILPQQMAGNSDDTQTSSPSIQVIRQLPRACPNQHFAFWSYCRFILLLAAHKLGVFSADHHVSPAVGMGWGDTALFPSTTGMAICSACRRRQVLVYSGQAAVVRCIGVASVCPNFARFLLSVSEASTVFL